MGRFKCLAKKFGFKESTFELKGSKRPLYSIHLSNRWKTRAQEEDIACSKGPAGAEL